MKKYCHLLIVTIHLATDEDALSSGCLRLIASIGFGSARIIIRIPAACTTTIEQDAVPGSSDTIALTCAAT
jgi:hypothetical protein